MKRITPPSKPPKTPTIKTVRSKHIRMFLGGVYLSFSSVLLICALYKPTEMRFCTIPPKIDINIEQSQYTDTESISKHCQNEVESKQSGL